MKTNDVALNYVKIDETLVKRVLRVVGMGLSDGLGDRTPGSMCIEAAVSFAIGDENHHDGPRCVEASLRDFKIQLNDNLDVHMSSKIRAKVLRRIGIAQLGTRRTRKKGYELDYIKFYNLMEANAVRLLDELNSRRYTERGAAFLKSAAELEERDVPSHDLSSLQESVRVYFNANDNEFLDSSNIDSAFFNSWTTQAIAAKMFTKQEDALAYAIDRVAVQALVKMKTPGSKFLYLTAEPKGPKKK